ncbi:cystathionine gamma-synthase [Fusarium circinatum]|uniref:Cystathionine gamma-synthase n=1 Tax=Fusarium circinatum TaxID=48490 RepID=A0A8H5UN05_FUSCI|nr:cystathionine gamma-synthase [Fusarium circinatum]
MTSTNRNWVYPNSLKALPLHQPHIYPQGTPHAVSSSLPTWQSVRDLAELVDRTQVDINYSYPRFFFCEPIQSLVERVRQRLKFGPDDLDCYIFPSSDNANDYVAQLGAKAITVHHFSALLVPPGHKACLMNIWAELGTSITTRHAQYCLDHFDELMSTSSLPEYNTQADREPSHDPDSAEWIRRGASDLAALKDFIAGLATSDEQDLTDVEAHDVFIYPNGMNAIYNASEAIAVNNLGTSVVTFGWIYHGTLSNLRQGQWKEVISFPLGREEDLDQLEAMLNPNDKKVYAVFCELPSNIKLTSPNLRRLRRIARDHDLVVVCDETVGNFVNVDLLPYVDIITTSLTKMFSGAANVTGGSVIVNPNSRHYDALHDAIRSRHDTVLCFPKDISVLRENSMNMVERVKRADASTLDVMKVFHRSQCSCPRLPSISRPRIQELRNAPPTKWRTRQSLQSDICKGASFGANFTIAIPFVQLTASDDDERENIDRHGLPKHIIRISVGLEDSGQICDKMKAALGEVETFELGPGSEF